MGRQPGILLVPADPTNKIEKNKMKNITLKLEKITAKQLTKQRPVEKDLIVHSGSEVYNF